MFARCCIGAVVRRPHDGGETARETRNREMVHCKTTTAELQPSPCCCHPVGCSLTVDEDGQGAVGGCDGQPGERPTNPIVKGNRGRDSMLSPAKLETFGTNPVAVRISDGTVVRLRVDASEDRRGLRRG